MNTKRNRYLLLILILVIAVVMFKDTLTQSGIEDLKGGFKEIAKYRNENNTGPVQRIFVVTVKDTVNAQYIDYGNLMPHNKYGNTKVYFFLEGNPVPHELTPGKVNFNEKYNNNCVALYEKSAMSNFGLVKYPFK